MKLRDLYIRWLVWRGKAIDIWSKSAYPANVLSNLCSNGFRLDGMICGSMEGFLQSLKQKDRDKQRQICSMKGKNAKKMTSTAWQTDQTLWWRGVAIDRQSHIFRKLVRRAYMAMFEQNERFRTALMSTRGMELFHSRGEKNSYKTILTEEEFCSVLTWLRDAYDDRHAGASANRKRIYITLEGLLAVTVPCKEVADTFELSPEASNAINILNSHYDCYMVTSVAPLDKPSLWSDRPSWIAKLFGNRIVMTDYKGTLNGDILIDSNNDTKDNFEGEVIRIGSIEFPDWKSILKYLDTDDKHQ